MTKTISDIVGSLRAWFKNTAGAGLVTLSLALDPMPTPRPRVGKFGTYYPKNYEEFRRKAKTITDAWPDEIPHKGPVAVLVEAIIPRPLKPTNPYPSKGDADNYGKGPIDAIVKSKKVWDDDRHIVMWLVTKRFAEPGEDPGYVVHWFPIET